MKKKLLYLVIFVLMLIVVACSNEVHSDLKNYKSDMKPLFSKEEEVLDEIDQLQLDKLDQLIGTEVTTEKNKELTELQNKLENHILPEVKNLKKQANKIETKTSEVEEAHSIYINNIEKKEDTISSLNKYIKHFDQSIKSNERIVAYTETFEQNKSEAESHAKAAQNKAEDQADYEDLVSRIDKNSEALNKKAKYLNNTHTVEEKAAYIDEEIIPLFKENVKSLNQTNINSKSVNQMRQSQIEMYYTLIKYYKERKKGMLIESELQQVDLPEGVDNQLTTLGKGDKYNKMIERLEK